jgi:hypothetical protein
MGERLTLRTVYERESELFKLEPYLEILKRSDSSIEEKQAAKEWLKKKLLEYTRAEGIYGNGVSSRDSAAEQGGLLVELRETILEVFAQFPESL